MKKQQVKQMKKKISLKKVVLIVLAMISTLGILIFILTAKIIGNQVYEQCNLALEKYSGDLSAGRQDCVSANMKLLDDKQSNFRVRNSAVWTLGQMGDKRALPVLEKYYTGKIQSKEPLNKSISQYELLKAINLCKGNLNITRFFWRR